MGHEIRNSYCTCLKPSTLARSRRLPAKFYFAECIQEKTLCFRETWLPRAILCRQGWQAVLGYGGGRRVNAERHIWHFCWCVAMVICTPPNTWSMGCEVYMCWWPGWGLPSRYDTMTQCWLTVGPASQTMGQQWANIGSMYRVSLVYVRLGKIIINT